MPICNYKLNTLQYARPKTQHGYRTFLVSIKSSRKPASQCPCPRTWCPCRVWCLPWISQPLPYCCEEARLSWKDVDLFLKASLSDSITSFTNFILDVIVKTSCESEVLGGCGDGLVVRWVCSWWRSPGFSSSCLETFLLEKLLFQNCFAVRNFEKVMDEKTPYSLIWTTRHSSDT